MDSSTSKMVSGPPPDWKALNWCGGRRVSLSGDPGLVHDNILIIKVFFVEKCLMIQMIQSEMKERNTNGIPDL